MAWGGVEVGIGGRVGKGWRRGESGGGSAAGHSGAHPCPHPHPIPPHLAEMVLLGSPPPHLAEVMPPGPLGGSRPQTEEVQLRRQDLLILGHAGEDKEEPHLLTLSCGEGRIGK